MPEVSRREGRRLLLRKLALAAFSVGFMLLLLEIVIRLVYPQPTDYFVFRRSYEPGSRYTVWGDVEVSINSHGQRDYERTLEKPPGVYRIALLGDSVAYGFGVDIEDSYSAQLENRLNEGAGGRMRFEVLRFTNGGNGPRGYLQMLQDDAVRFDPDLVLVGFTLNDFELAGRKKTPRQRAYGALRYVHSRMRVSSHLYYLVFERSRAQLYRAGILDKSVLAGLSLEALETRGERFEQAWSHTRGNLDRIRDVSVDAGARFAMLVFPFEMQLNRELLDLYRHGYNLELSDGVLEDKPQRLLQSYGETNDFETLDLTEAFRSSADAGEQLFFREIGGTLDFCHPNQPGHALAAGVLYDSLRCGSVLPDEVSALLPSEGCARTAASAPETLAALQPASP